MTVLAAIQKSAEFLGKKGVESPRLQAELLLAHLLKLPRLKLYLNFERTLAPAETDTLRELVKRRGQREPLQHIVGSTSFCGYEIAVNRRALVPRPETELLAELGWQFLQGRADLPVGQDAQQRIPPSSSGAGLRRRRRRHRHRARGEMSERKNRRNGHFGGCARPCERKRGGKPSRGAH